MRASRTRGSWPQGPRGPCFRGKRTRPAAFLAWRPRGPCAWTNRPGANGAIAGRIAAKAPQLAAFPDVVPLAESGLGNFDYASWSAVVAPAGVPPEIVRKVQQAFARVSPVAFSPPAGPWP